MKRAGELSIRDRLDLSKILTTGILVILFFPLIQLLVSTVSDIIFNSSDIELILPVGRRFALLVNSISLAGTVSLSVTIFGFICGSLILGENEGVLRIVKLVVLLTAPVPPYIYALTWSTFVRSVKSLLGGYGDWIQMSGFPMSYCVYVLAYLPLGVGLALIGLRLVERPAVEAARVFREDYYAFTRVVLPLAWPSVVTSLGLVFILVITDFSVPMLFGFNVYSLEVFSEFSASNSTSNSLLLSTPVMLSCFLWLFYYVNGIRATTQSSSVGQVSGFNEWNLPSWFRAVQQMTLSFAVLQVTLLVGGLVKETGSFSSLWYALTAASDDFVTSFIISMSSALLGAGIGYVLSDRLEENQFWWWLLSLPISTPAALIGISLILSYNNLVPWLYGSLWMPIIASVTRFVPLSAIIVYAQKRKIDRLLFDAADLFSSSRNEGWMKIKLPLQKYGIAAAALITFTLSLGELGGTLLVIPPGRETLTIRIFNYLHYGGTEEVAGLCLALVVITMTLTGLAMVVYNRSVLR